MANKNYERGRYFEYQERDYQESKGLWAERSYASKGTFDVIATDGKVTRFIEVKSYKGRLRKSFKEAMERLGAVPAGPNVERLLVIYGPVKPGVETPRQEIVV